MSGLRRKADPTLEPGPVPEGFPAVDDEEERAQIERDIEVDVPAGLPTPYSPREKPPLREQQVAVRHNAHQRHVGAWVTSEERHLQEVLLLTEGEVVAAERTVGGIEHRVAGLERELEAEDEKLKEHHASRRFEKVPPVALYALPVLIGIADFPYTSGAFAFITNSDSGDKYAFGALAAQVVAYHFIGSLLKDLVATPMNRAKRRATLALVGALATAALVFGVGIVAIRATSGSSGAEDAVTFAGLQLIFAVAATVVAFVVHSPIAAGRRQVAREVAAARRRLTDARKDLSAAEQSCADAKATLDSFEATVTERSIAVQHAFEDLALYARRLAQARFTAHDGNTGRAELLEHFPLPQMVPPVRDGDLADEPLLVGPVQLRLF